MEVFQHGCSRATKRGLVASKVLAETLFLEYPYLALGMELGKEIENTDGVRKEFIEIYWIYPVSIVKYAYPPFLRGWSCMESKNLKEKHVGSKSASKYSKRFHMVISSMLSPAHYLLSECTLTVPLYPAAV